MLTAFSLCVQCGEDLLLASTTARESARLWGCSGDSVWESGQGCYFMGVEVDSGTGLSDVVVDATVSGNLTRFNNHTTTPSCVVEDTKHGAVLVLEIFATKHIRASE